MLPSQEGPQSLPTPEASGPAAPSAHPGETEAPAPAVPFMRTIKSYVLRAGRTTTAQARAYTEHGPVHLVNFRPQALQAEDVVQWFGRSAPLILEIGFGMGEATAHIARVRPHDNFLCCEVHEPGVGALLKRAGEQGLGNIRILRHDAVEVIDHMLPVADALGQGALLDGVHVFFPDPWHKTKHHKRRLIQPPLVAKLAQRLKPGGYIHCATDWAPYAEQMREVLGQEPLLVNTSDAPDGYAPQPEYRPLTKFENRGRKLGHGVWDLVFRRRAVA